MSDIKWTDEQLDVINSVDTNTLVSASAGSGKTAVMIERVVQLIVGEDGKKKTPLKRIVMVTFNESVASELKSKISAQLAKRLAISGDKEYIRSQIEDVPIADISTMHSLCSMIIKNNFEYLDIQPSFSIVDDKEKQVLFGKAITNVMKEYRENYDYQIDILINYLGGEKGFCDILAKLYSFLEAQLDRESYLEKIAFVNYDGDFKNSDLAKQYIAGMHGVFFDLLQEGQEFLTAFEDGGLNSHINNAQCIIDFLQKLYATKDIEELAELTKLTPEFPAIRQPSKDKIDEYLDLHEKYKAYKSGFTKTTKELKGIFSKPYTQIQDELNKNKEYLIRLVDILKKVYSEYLALKRKDNKMDFADLEYFAVKAMQNDDIASELRSNYDYICVDEYQDINEVQDYILTRLSNGKNLFMVGDVKQSIYQFRMTDPQIFLNKYGEYKRYPQLGSSFSLNSNYRSCKEVVDFVNAVFEVIMTKDMGGINYQTDSKLIQGNKSYDLQSGMPIRIAFFPKEDERINNLSLEDGVYSVRADARDGEVGYSQEGRYIAKQIKSLVGKEQIQVSTADGSMEYRNIKYSDIALLCRARHDNVAAIVEELKSAGIPVDSSNITKDKDNTCVSLFTTFIRVIDNYRQDVPLMKILTSNVFAKFSYRDMATIRAAYCADKSVDFFHKAVDRYCEEHDDDLAKRLEEFFEMLDYYRRISSFMGVDELLRKLIADFNYREYMTSIDGGVREFVGLETFIRSLEGKPYNASLFKFIEAADSTADFGKVSGEVGYEGDCVVTNTIHSSKGLEYPIVFFIDAGRRFNVKELNESKIIYDKESGFAIKNFDEQDRFFEDSLPMLWLRKSKVKDIIEECMRLFYVVTTRARNMLYITATGGLGGGKVSTFAEKQIDNPMSIIDWLNNVAFADGKFFDKYFDVDVLEEDNLRNVKRELTDFSKRRLVDVDCARDFAQRLQSDYAYQEATSLLVKHTVTGVNNDYYNSLSDVIYAKQDSEEILESLKDSDFSDEEIMDKRNRADEGIAYHRVLECIDYDCFTVGDVIDRLDAMVEQGLLTDEQREIIDPKSILECLQSEVMQQARKYPHYREKQFMLNLPASEFLQVSSDDKVLLQGTIDLFIQGGGNGGENILVDFKFSHKSEEQVKKRYCKQLELYSKAIEECIGVKVDKRIIFMLGKNRIIII